MDSAFLLEPSVAHRKDLGSNYSLVAIQAAHRARVQVVQHLVDLQVLHNGQAHVEASQWVRHAAG